MQACILSCILLVFVTVRASPTDSVLTVGTDGEASQVNFFGDIHSYSLTNLGKGYLELNSDSGPLFTLAGSEASPDEVADGLVSETVLLQTQERFRMKDPQPNDPALLLLKLLHNRDATVKEPVAVPVEVPKVAAAVDRDVAPGLTVRQMTSQGDLSILEPRFVINKLPQWILLQHEDFESETSSSSWTDLSDARSECGTPNDFFLGGYCVFGDIEVKKEFVDLPEHSALRIQARFHFIDKWEGEAGYASIDDREVWRASYRHCDKIFEDLCRGINVCGDNHYADQLSTLIDVTLPHTAESFILSFGSTLTEMGCTASWGVDDIMVYVM